VKEHAPPGNAKAARQGDFASESTTRENSHAGEMPTSRNRQHRGFFRVSEEAMRKIAYSFEQPWAIRAATLAYVVLCRKTNLRGRNTFEDTIGSLAQDMSFPYREAQRAVRLLEGIGLVSIERRKIPGTKANAPNIYTVSTLLHDAITLERGDGTLGEDGLRISSPQLSQELPQKLHTYIPEEGSK